MNILLIHNYYQQRGGEDAVFENEFSALSTQEVNVFKYEVFNSQISGTSFFSKIFSLFNILYNGHVYRDIKNIIEKENIEIVHVHNVFPLITPRIYRILKKYRVKIIQTVHNYRFICPNGLLFRNNSICYECRGGKFFNCIRYRCYKDSFIFSFLYSYLIKRYSKDFRRKIDLFIALNDFVRDKLVDAGFDSSKIVIKDNMASDSDLKRKSDGGYYLFLGRLSSEKGVEFMTECFSENGFKLTVGGDGPVLELLRKKYASFQNINFSGFVTGDKKNELLAGASALIVPSVWYENYPMTIVEAFKAGIPVIASDIGGLSSIINDNVNGFLFEPASCRSLIEILTSFSSEIRERTGDAARQTFIERMEKNANVRKLIGIYKSVL